MLNLFFVYSDIVVCHVRIKILAPHFEKWGDITKKESLDSGNILQGILLKKIFYSGKILKVASPKDGSQPIFFWQVRTLCNFARDFTRSAYDFTKIAFESFI